MTEKKEAKEAKEEVKKEEAKGQYAKLYNEARENRRTKKMLPTFVQFTAPGVCIIGKFLSRSEVGGGDNKRAYVQYIFETDNGTVKFHLGNITDNDAGTLMREGRIYYIEFLGQEKIAGGKRVNKFDVQRVYTEEEIRVGGDDDMPF